MSARRITSEQERILRAAIRGALHHQRGYYVIEDLLSTERQPTHRSVRKLFALGLVTDGPSGSVVATPEGHQEVAP